MQQQEPLFSYHPSKSPQQNLTMPCEEQESAHIVVKMGGISTSVCVPFQSLVSELKHKIFDIFGVPVPSQWLLLCGHVLKEDNITILQALSKAPRHLRNNGTREKPLVMHLVQRESPLSPDEKQAKEQVVSGTLAFSSNSTVSALQLNTFVQKIIQEALTTQTPKQSCQIQEKPVDIAAFASQEITVLLNRMHSLLYSSQQLYHTPQPQSDAVTLPTYLRDSSQVMQTLSSRLVKLAAILESGYSVSDQTRREASEMGPLLQQLAVLLGLVSGALSDITKPCENSTEFAANTDISASSSIPIQTPVGTGFLTVHTSTVFHDEPTPPPAKKQRF